MTGKPKADELFLAQHSPAELTNAEDLLVPLNIFLILVFYMLPCKPFLPLEQSFQFVTKCETSFSLKKKQFKAYSQI
jgi:hypothetical protein